MEPKKQTLDQIKYKYDNFNNQYHDKRLEHMASGLLNNWFEGNQVAETTCVTDRYSCTISECSITIAKPAIKLFDDRMLEAVYIHPDLTLVFKYADKKYYVIKDQTVLYENNNDESRPVADFIRRAFVEEAEKLFKSQPIKQPPNYMLYHKIAELGSIGITPYAPVNSVILEMKKYFSPDTSIRIDVFPSETAKIVVRHPTVVCKAEPLKSKITRMIEFGATDRAYSRGYMLSWLTKSNVEIHYENGMARLDSAISTMHKCFADFATGQMNFNTIWC
jgi:hypothetical protein